MADPENAEQSISAAEIALYDRQIRLWGVSAQKKIGAAKILLISVKALANEVAKNLVLAGIGSLTIIDHEIVKEDDLSAQFFVSEEHVGQNRAQAAGPQIHKMNPRVDLQIDTDDVKTKAPEFFAQFDVTIATDLDFMTYNSINTACRVAQKPFYAAGLHGFYGYVFADLITHDFVIERAKSNVPPQQQETPTRSVVDITTKKENDKTIELITKRETYSPLLLANTSPLPEEFTRNSRRRKQTELAEFTKLSREAHHFLKLDPETLDAEFLRKFLQNLGGELSPVAAFMGGALAQDVINVLSAREQPLQNLLLFDGDRSIGPIYSLHPFFPPEMEALAAVPPVANPIPLDADVVPPTTIA
ncbi:SUMO activating enzyme [Penicillium riverlandense]|uniref:SUMO activating enzyme n=1 Tax=Penicillium riverlandense TaxID=1903569 RepID=UPI002548870D|nr:SUMO activating enzyme [Penicillium riverlandense]KAJ5812499.1 SUMO activating enzyme [Penicillium riverlandense]